MKFFLIFLGFIITANAEEISGVAEVIDGDHLRIGDAEIRLYGIDAPEEKQTCIYRGEDWSCGKTAIDGLKQIVGNAIIRCTWTQQHHDGAALGKCHREDYDIAELMVVNGLALADTEYSGMYIPDEMKAKAERKGLWSARFIPPRDWRRGVRLAGNELPASECPVKGDLNSNGKKIYYVKGWRDYAQVTLNTEQGGRCFLTVEAALLAGFKPARQ